MPRNKTAFLFLLPKGAGELKGGSKLRLGLRWGGCAVHTWLCRIWGDHGPGLSCSLTWLPGSRMKMVMEPSSFLLAFLKLSSSRSFPGFWLSWVKRDPRSYTQAWGQRDLDLCAPRPLGRGQQGWGLSSVPGEVLMLPSPPLSVGRGMSGTSEPAAALTPAGAAHYL